MASEPNHAAAVDVVGIGAGPANLSLAALLTPVSSLHLRLLEQRPAVSWHPGLLLPGASMQVSFLKDLVTPVLPTSPYSFLSFLVEHKRFYRFTAAGYERPSRAEFDQYLRWAAGRLPSIEYGQRVDAVEYGADGFAAQAGGRVHAARSIVLATGPVPYVPEFARRHLGKTVFHASEYAFQRPAAHQRVAVVGGGQTGAEVFLDLLDNQCHDILLVTRRSNLLPLDDSPFTNELFTPNYVTRFFELDPETRRQLLVEQRLASDGISTDLLQQIYRRLYQLDCTGAALGVRPVVAPRQELVGLQPRGDGWLLATRHVGTGQVRTEVADVVVLATGYTHDLPGYLDPLRGRICFDRQLPVVRSNFSLVWDGPGDANIYLQNAARHSHGIADPNLSLLAWRSAVIANSLSGKDLYDVSDHPSTLDWDERQT
jgi:lysine N6-hydroxylase